MSAIEIVEINEPTPLSDYLTAKNIASNKAQQRLENVILLTWSGRDRDFESPLH